MLAVGGCRGGLCGKRPRLPRVRHRWFQTAQKRTTAGHSWAHRQSCWHLCGNIFKKGQRQDEGTKRVRNSWGTARWEEEEVLRVGAGIPPPPRDHIPWRTHTCTHTHPAVCTVPWRDWGLWIRSRYTPKQTAAGGGPTPEHRKRVRRREQQRETLVSQLHPPPAIASLKGLGVTCSDKLGWGFGEERCLDEDKPGKGREKVVAFSV